MSQTNIAKAQAVANANKVRRISGVVKAVRMPVDLADDLKQLARSNNLDLGSQIRLICTQHVRALKAQEGSAR